MSLFSQAKATLTEKNLGDQSGKVFVITGSTSGVGFELANILYAHHAKVYVAARSAEKARVTIDTIRNQTPNSTGELVFLKLDLNDLSTIKKSAEEFLGKETRLDVLWNNAGVMVPPQGSKTEQGFELQLGTNNLAPFLFTKLLIPIMIETAKKAPQDSVRVVWVASSAAERFSPKDGVDMSNLDYKVDQSAWHKYGVSKAGNILHGKECARRYGSTGIVSVSLDPGNLKTDLYKHVGGFMRFLVNTLVLKDPIWGAYTELFGGLSPDVTSKHNGTFIIPWGKISEARKDIEIAAKPESEGGTGIGEQFWAWSEEMVSQYA